MATKEKPTLPVTEHASGCPAERIEEYTSRRPDGTTVAVTRCMDCGGQRVKEQHG